MLISRTTSALVVVLWASFAIAAEVCQTLPSGGSNSAFCSTQLKSCEQTCKGKTKENECSLKTTTSACFTCECEATEEPTKTSSSARQVTTTPAAQTSKKEEEPVKTTEKASTTTPAAETSTTAAQSSTPSSSASIPLSTSAPTNTASTSSSTLSTSASAAAAAGVTDRPAFRNTRTSAQGSDTTTDRFRIVRTGSQRAAPTEQVKPAQNGAGPLGRSRSGGWVAGALAIGAVAVGL